MKSISYGTVVLMCLLLIFCEQRKDEIKSPETGLLPSNVLNYSASPKSPNDKSALAFSDQGAWFAYGYSDSTDHLGGFSGPFLMTQDNGAWISPALSKLSLMNSITDEVIDWVSFEVTMSSYNSHIEQFYMSEALNLKQSLFFCSPHSAMIISEITNVSQHTIEIIPSWGGQTFLDGISLTSFKNGIRIDSERSLAKGYVRVTEELDNVKIESDSSYQITLKSKRIEPGETHSILLTHSFIFPEYSTTHEENLLGSISRQALEYLKGRKLEKEKQFEHLLDRIDPNWSENESGDLLAKTVLTLQNNWRIPAGELLHSGLFPSYHYLWFHGFWAWDSWKHAVALAEFNPILARDQIWAMFDFQDDEGFIADCVYRDTTIEAHNYRNTKPPLSAWATWKVFEASQDVDFLKEIYPLIVLQHKWWYKSRDHDQDGLCEYGSTDGSLIAAKWESGMDNAVRFDESKILQNSEYAYSLDQESVDLNSYLYAEKVFLGKIATAINKPEESSEYSRESISLQAKIQEQFYDEETGWFYDTSIDGAQFISAMGCEGWIPLWANIATPIQASMVKQTMMDSSHFFTRVPFQTLDASHPEFAPDGGYWRGPTWLDQAYFGVKGLHNYGYSAEANSATKRLLYNAEGVMGKGASIRENYNPITGDGLNSRNFSWSAAHYLLLLLGG